MTDQVGAFQVLAELAQITRRNARGLPAQVDIQPYWSGIGFSLLGRHFVAPMGQVAEMLEVPGMTRLPGVKPWVKGVANVRGRLLPLIDFAQFLGGRLTGYRKQQRVLVLDIDGFYSGLVVDQVFGMQHFPVDTFQRDDDSTVQFAAMLDGSYQSEGTRWTVFNIVDLLNDQEFVNAASG